MKLQRTQKAVLATFVFLLTNKFPPRFGKIFHKWCMKQLEEKYPLFFWALRK